MIFTSSVPLRGACGRWRGIHRRRRTARGAGGQRGIDVARLDAARGPVPVTVARSSPASAARRRDAGDTMTRADLPSPLPCAIGRGDGSRFSRLLRGAALRRQRLGGGGAGVFARRCIARGGGGGIGVEHHELGADGDHVAGLPCDGEDAAA